MDELTKHVARKEYLQVQGLPALCEKVAKFHNHYDHLNIKGENVLIGNGSKMLIYAILNSFRQANVFLVTPCWVSYEPQADLAKLNTVRIETTYEEGWRLTPTRLRKSLAHYSSDATPSICIFNFPGNPDGLSYTDSEVRALAAVFREFNVLVISDEIYGLLDHTGSHISMARYYPEGTIVTSGLSKWCGAGGWRVGVALFPTSLEATLKPVVVGILSETISCVSAPIQYAAVVAYTLDPRVDAYLAHQRRILSLAGGMFHDRLTKVGIRFVKPTGGFYLYIDFTPLAKILVDRRGISTSYDLATDLLCRAGIAILPGNAFGAPTHVMSARLAYVDFNGAAAMTASTAIGLDTELTEDFLEEHTPKLVAGCDAIVNYCTDLVQEVPLTF
jgi:aspartate aminotransferase